MAIGEGFMSSAGLIFFLFGIGAFMNVVIKSKSMEAAVGGLLKKTKGKEIMIIPILMIFFAAGGTVYGMAEETLVFYAILVPVFLLAGFDSLTAVFTILLGAGVGVAASTVNPFAIGAAIDAIPGVTTSLGDGMMFRFISVAIFASLAISFVMIRAKKIQQGK
ncbi:MAG: hypothetical protein DRP42_05570 [Tenericutes bacterium]|nr:MAG: hypothetical protein DRP42_05570 [Mycoplasmatota bacterium]